MLFLDEGPNRGNADDQRVLAEHNVTVVLFRSHLPEVQQPIELLWMRRLSSDT
jgi:hypothetical protein